VDSRWRRGGLHVVEAGDRPHRRIARRALELRLRRLAADAAVVVGRFAHAFEGVEQPEVSRGVAARHQRERHGHHAAPAPHAAFDDVACDAVTHEVVDGTEQAGAALQAVIV
jgi:hypothetical protein